MSDIFTALQSSPQLNELEFHIDRECEGGFDSDSQSLIEVGNGLPNIATLKKLIISLGCNY